VCVIGLGGMDAPAGR